eukprot:GHVU01040282.1.p1 GENE.GHVU01040282.1~~GHVU01040282.1.p1  ORF type:complete len:116 (+),score=7.00 GHVU01040282.1:811-1158(+)
MFAAHPQNHLLTQLAPPLQYTASQSTLIGNLSQAERHQQLQPNFRQGSLLYSLVLRVVVVLALVVVVVVLATVAVIAVVVVVAVATLVVAVVALSIMVVVLVGCAVLDDMRRKGA